MEIDLPFIIQIVLTIAAWVRGWQWKALIPIAAGFASNFIVPTFFGGLDENTFGILALVINLAIIGALVYMIVKPQKVKKTK